MWGAASSRRRIRLAGRLVGLSERVQKVKFSHDGKKLAVAGGLPARSGEIQIWNVGSKRLSMSIPVGFDTLYGISWSPDNKKVAVGLSDSTLRAFDISSGKQVLFKNHHDDWVLDTVWNNKGDHLVSVGRDMAVKLTEVATSRFVRQHHLHHPGRTQAAASTPSRCTRKKRKCSSVARTVCRRFSGCRV